jgi:hypothetical protein
MTEPVLGRAYRGCEVALVTRHDKGPAIAPAFADTLGARLVVIDDIDTDALGTFTRDIPRAGTQLEAARRKARLALERGHACGLGSEGAFLPGPFGLGSHDLELLVFLDDARGLEVVGRALEPGRHVHGVATSLAELAALAGRAGFPEHGLVVRPDDEDDPRVHKGLRTEGALHEAFDVARRASRGGRVFVESDLRAHQNPTRRAVIARAAADLVARLACHCPSCDSPGWGVVGRRPGLPCQWCGTPTSEPLADVFGCPRCPHRVQHPVDGPATADPGRCDLCNP